MSHDENPKMENETVKNPEETQSIRRPKEEEEGGMEEQRKEGLSGVLRAMDVGSEYAVKIQKKSLIFKEGY